MNNSWIRVVFGLMVVTAPLALAGCNGETTTPPAPAPATTPAPGAATTPAPSEGGAAPAAPAAPAK